MPFRVEAIATLGGNEESTNLLWSHFADTHHTHHSNPLSVSTQASQHHKAKAFQNAEQQTYEKKNWQLFAVVITASAWQSTRAPGTPKVLC